MENHKRYGAYDVRMARNLAFLGRYAHQPVSAVMDLTTMRFYRLIIATGKLLDDEAAATAEATRRR